MSVIHLEISSFRGISIGAIHYYGLIRAAYDSHYDRAVPGHHGSKHELRYLIEQQHLDMMEKLCDPRDWYPNDWQIGYETSRFFTKDAVIEAGIKAFNEHYDPSVDVLTNWKSVYMWNSQKDTFLAGNKEVIDYINSLTNNREIDLYLRKLN